MSRIQFNILIIIHFLWFNSFGQITYEDLRLIGTPSYNVKIGGAYLDNNYLYVVGDMGSYSPSKIFVMKFKYCSMDTVWSFSYDWPYRDVSFGITVKNDTVYITHWVTGGGDDVGLTLIDGNSGNIIATYKWNIGDDQVRSVAKLPKTNDIILGGESSAGGWGLFLIRFSPLSNSVVWSKIISNYGVEGSSKILIDSINNNIYYAGGRAWREFMIVKLKYDGTIKWVRIIKFPGITNGQCPAPYVCVANGIDIVNGTLYLVGGIDKSFHNQGLGGHDIAIIAIDTATGSVKWSKVYGTTTGNEDQYWFGYRIELDPQDSNKLIVMTQTNAFASTLGFGGYDLLLFKIDTLGNIKGSPILLGTNYDDRATFTTLPDSRILIWGTTFGSIRKGILGILPSNFNDISCHVNVNIQTDTLNVFIDSSYNVNNFSFSANSTPSISTISLSTDTICHTVFNINSILDSIKHTCFGTNDGFIALDSTTLINSTIIWSTGDTSYYINNLSPDTYYVYINTFECMDTFMYEILQLDSLYLNGNTIIKSPTKCDSNLYNGEIKVNINGGASPYQHFWNTGDTGSYLTNLGPGIYIDSVVDAAGCYKSFMFKLDSPTFTMPLSIELDSCISINPLKILLRVNVDSLGVLKILWSTGDSSWYTIYESGTVYVEITDTNMCNGIDSININYNKPEVLIDPRIDSIFSGDTVKVSILTNSPIDIHWINDSSLLVVSNYEALVYPHNNTIYHLYYSDTIGCMYYDSVIIYVKENKVYFPSIFTPNGDGINDTYGPVYFGNISLEWMVYNRWGQLIFHGNEKSRWDGTLDGKPQPSGRYVVVVYIKNESAKEVISKKILSLYLIR